MENQNQMPKATKQHCKYCFDVLINSLQKKQLPQWPQHFINYKLSIFITWKKKGDLRGCIGTFSPDQIKTILSQYAITAAMKDPRFPSIKQNQLKDLSVGVSFLVNFQQRGNKPYDWIIGKHGIIIKAKMNGINYSSTFLPQVALQHNFTQEVALKRLIQKAGFNGDFQSFLAKTELTTYQSSKQYMTYDQYINFGKK